MRRFGLGLAVVLALGCQHPSQPAPIATGPVDVTRLTDEQLVPHMDEGGPVLASVNGLAASITAGGAHLRFGDRAATLALAAIDRASARVSLSSASPTIEGADVRTERGAGVTEWWRTLPRGLEHGVTIATRPGGEGELVLRVALDGLTAQPLSSDSVALLDAASVRVGTYAELVVVDAAGRPLAATMRAEGNAIALHVDDRDARYPIVIDPLVTQEEAILTATTPSSNGGFGRRTAMSADGTVAIVSAEQIAPTVAPVVQPFLRTGTSWVADGTPLSFGGTNPLSGIALSADGSRIAISGGTGTLRIYTRASTWSVEATLSTPGSLAFSADGTRLVAGSNVYLRTGTSWALESALPLSMGLFVATVTMSADGGRVVLATLAATSSAQVISFVRSGSAWSQETVVTMLPMLGQSSLALDDTATRLFVGRTSGGMAGQLLVYLRTGSAWALEATLTASDTHVGDLFGASVATNGSGSRVLVGAPDDISMTTPGPGTVRVLSRTGTTWTEDAIIHASAEANRDAFGTAVAISNDGSRGLATSPADTTPSAVANAGTARVVRIGAPTGTSCGLATDCASGFCVDGVCCATACGGGSATDCQACSAALTGGADGTCAALSVAVAPTVVCRVADDLCDAPERCTASSTSCPADAARVTGFACRPSVDVCDLPEVCDGTSHICPGNAFSGAGTVCRATAGSCDVPEVCSGSSPTCPADAIRPVGAVCLAGSGSPCDLDDTCDGVSTSCAPRYASVATICGPPALTGCDLPDHCSGTSSDCVGVVASPGALCRASAGGCDVPESCDGVLPTCPVDLYRPTGDVCRMAAGGCDRDERCEGGPSCPADVIASAGAMCRPSAGACDVPETCSGLDVACPLDLHAMAGTVCRAPIDTCDVAEACTGIDVACPSDAVMTGGTTCRPSLGGCDPAELCDGSSGACPGDARSPSGTACGGAVVGSCSTHGTCDGTSVSCPGATPLAANTVCMAADPTVPCDADDVCDGTTDVCAPRYAPSTRSCGAPASDACDAPDHCAGTSADCVDAFVSGVPCRASAGACDPAELCSGGAASCPPDQVQPTGTGCRDSNGMTCDPAEVCDGTAPSCPADQNTCAMDAGSVDGGALTDAGARDAASATDARATDGGGADAGPITTPVSCGCRAGARSTGTLALFSALALVLARRTRRQRPRNGI